MVHDDLGESGAASDGKQVMAAYDGRTDHPNRWSVALLAGGRGFSPWERPRTPIVGGSILDGWRAGSERSPYNGRHATPSAKRLKPGETAKHCPAAGTPKRGVCIPRRWRTRLTAPSRPAHPRNGPMPMSTRPRTKHRPPRLDIADVRRLIPLACFLLAMAGVARASTGVADETPAARWSFEVPGSGGEVAHGNATFGEPGPRPPEFPDFSPDNRALRLDGRGAYLAIPDEGNESRFDFGDGDPITLEAWVHVERIRNGQMMYVIGKGRTGDDGFDRDNQNWALRVVGEGELAKVGFLFASRPDGDAGHWHRWTSRAGFHASTGWHHIAVAYRFGDPASIRGWIDGRPTDGDWDMAGATSRPPVVDNDAVWIGSSMGANPGSSFSGWLDDVAVHRARLDDEQVQSRFRRVGGPRVVRRQTEVMPDLGELPPGRVVMTLGEGLPSHTRWLNDDESWPEAAVRRTGDHFLLPRVPQNYDEWGLRDRWAAPLLLRMAADVELPPGPLRFLVRARGMSRLWVDGELVARTDADTARPPDGEEPITPPAEPPRPGTRPHGYRQQEVVTEVQIPQGLSARAAKETAGTAVRSRVVWEIVVGGDDHRTETGEILVAWLAPEAEHYLVLGPRAGHALPLTDEAVTPALRRIESSLVGEDDRRRRLAAASMDPFWDRRHQIARRWAERHPAPPVPAVAAPESRAAHPVDAFLMAKIFRIRTAGTSGTAGQGSSAGQHPELPEGLPGHQLPEGQSLPEGLPEGQSLSEGDGGQRGSGAEPAAAEPPVDFHREILPIFREHCFRCHGGDKDNGGLRLDTRGAALAGGDSGQAAVAPHDPEASELISRILEDDESLRMPPSDRALDESEVGRLVRWVRQGAVWPERPLATAHPEPPGVPLLVDDATFLRRAFLDTIGIPPTAEQVREFLRDTDPRKRERWIDRLLEDEAYADHWMSLWLDLLAENPTLINESLNSTGPFRWFLYDSLRDNRPIDRMVTELILMRGDAAHGGSAGFALAGENDAPMAEKGHIVASAFLGVELQCARCHDSPYHRTTQEDLFSLAAMLSRDKLTVPPTSRVPDAFFQAQSRQSLISVTLDPAQAIEPRWPFADVTGVQDGPEIDRLMVDPEDSRERLAALITAAPNRRFARVIANRYWRQLMGAGMVEPVHDWEGNEPSHPELLDWLASEFVTQGYDAKHLIRRIMTSQAYQREAIGTNGNRPPEDRDFLAPDRRRLTAEQVVDSLHHATGRAMEVEELTFVHDGRRPLGKRQTLGTPRRAWMFATLNNERDRPSLALPQARAVADVLEAFGWTGSRQKPIHERETEPNLLQPGVLANGSLSHSLTRIAAGSELADLAISAESPPGLTETLFLRFLGRPPRPAERAEFAGVLSKGFADRHLPVSEIEWPRPPDRLPQVTWFNHLRPEANEIQMEIEHRVRSGPPPDPRLRATWRAAYEDVVWALVNHRDFVWIP